MEPSSIISYISSNKVNQIILPEMICFPYAHMDFQ